MDEKANVGGGSMEEGGWYGRMGMVWKEGEWYEEGGIMWKGKEKGAKAWVMAAGVWGMWELPAVSPKIT